MLLGLSGSGQSSIVHALEARSHPTITDSIINTISDTNRGLEFVFLDIERHDRVRPIFRHFFNNIQALIYVLDGADGARFDEAREYLLSFLKEDELRDASLLVLVNKQDLPGAIGAEDASHLLQLSCLPGRRYHTMPCCALSGDGLNEALEWLATSTTAPTP